MRATCIENMYTRRGSQVHPEPSFLVGKSYEIKQGGFYSGGFLDLGDYELVNERGIDSIMSKGMFDRHFIIEDYSNDWVIE